MDSFYANYQRSEVCSFRHSVRSSKINRYERSKSCLLSIKFVFGAYSFMSQTQSFKAYTCLWNDGQKEIVKL